MKKLKPFYEDAYRGWLIAPEAEQCAVINAELEIQPDGTVWYASEPTITGLHVCTGNGEGMEIGHPIAVHVRRDECVLSDLERERMPHNQQGDLLLVLKRPALRDCGLKMDEARREVAEALELMLSCQPCQPRQPRKKGGRTCATT